MQKPVVKAPHVLRHSLDFIMSNGEVSRLLRYRISTCPQLGDPGSWPQSLRTAISICLYAPIVSAIYWGPDFILLYNDAYAEVLGDRHPSALCRPFREVWPEMEHILEGQLKLVLDTGQSFTVKNQKLAYLKSSVVTETFWSYSFTPIFSERDEIGGIFLTAIDNTSDFLKGVVR